LVEDSRVEMPWLKGNTAILRHKADGRGASKGSTSPALVALRNDPL
jgi:hypothetical protein